MPPGAGGYSDVLSLPDGTLIVATKTSGLRFYERSANGNYAWRTVTSPTRGAGLASNNLTRLALFQGELWVGTSDAGVSILNFKTGDWRTLNKANTAAFPSNSITCLTPVGPDPTISRPDSTDEVMWVGTNLGAVRYSYVSILQLQGWIWTRIDAADGLPQNYVRDIAVQFRGGERYTWFATDEILTRWDGSNFDGYGGSCDMNSAERILVADDGDIWFAALKVIPALNGPGDGGGGGAVIVPNGLCRLSYGLLGLATWTHYIQQYGHDMSFDDSGRLWTCGVEQFAASSSGAWVHDQGTWCVFTSVNSQLSGDQVGAVHALGEVTCYAQDNTNVLDTYSNNWSTLAKSRLNVSGPIGPVEFTPLGTLVGGDSAVSYNFPGSPVPWPRWNLGNTAAPVSAFLVEWPVVWVGLDGDGLRRIELRPQNGQVVKIDSFTAADGLGDDGVTSILRDKGGRLWVGTHGGLSLQGNGYWLNFKAQNSGLVSSDVTSLCLAHAARLFIGTSAGIGVLNPDSLGGGAWASFTTADGLPSNEVRGLAKGVADVVWAITAGGAAEYDLHTFVWKKHVASSGELPSNDCLSVAVDSTGRAWIGTAEGLAMNEGATWRHFHPTSSTLLNDIVTHLAVKSDEVWAVNGDTIAVRKNIIGPIGNFPPQITSFQPAIAAPGTSVTVTGKYFDPRGPQYNEVIVGTQEVTGGVAAKPAEIVSVSAAQIVFKVPDRADSGQLHVTSHCLQTTSNTELIVGPAITSVSPTCASLGDEISIHGAGFFSSGGVVVRFGNGPWRSPAGTPGDHLSANLITIHLREGDLEGKVQVKNNDNAVGTSSESITIGHLLPDGYKVLQGVEGLRLIWGKRTLVSLKLKAQGCSTKVGGGKLYWKKKDGTLQLGGKAYAVFWDQDLRVELAEPTAINEDFTSLEFIGEFASGRSGWEDFFPLSQLDGIRVVVQNNKIDALTVDIPRSELGFKEIKKKLELFAIGVFPKNGGTSWSKFWADAGESLTSCARQLPQPDFGPFYGDQSWIGISSSYFTVDSADLRSNVLGADVFNDYTHITGEAGDLIEPGFGQFGMAIVDNALYVDHPDDVDPSGKAPLGPFFDGNTAVSFNVENKAGAIITQELCHMLGLVDGDAENNDEQNDHHSRYDEGEDYEEGTNCALSDYLTYGDAVMDQLGTQYPLIRWITDGAPTRVPTGSCIKERAKSSMSYAPGQKNSQSFLEPLDYEAVIHYLNDLYEESGEGGGAGLGGGPTAVLSVRGLISMQGQVQVTLCYLDESGSPATRAEPESEFVANVLDGAGGTLVSLPFRIDFHAHGDINASTAFQVRVPYPAEARKVELRHGGALLWSKTQSANAPAVSFIAPNGGTFSGDSDVPVSWNASDPDGDALQFALEYSPDDGTSWIKLPQFLQGTSYSWRPGYLPKSSSARLKIRASDGFNTATAVSAPFRLTPAQPIVFIRSPEGGASIPEGSTVDLVAESMTSEGFNLGSFAWQVDSEALPGVDRGTEYRFDRTGARVVKVTLTAGTQQATAQVTVQVYPDYDHDGLPNDWELAHGLSPLDYTDAVADTDGDGLVNLDEYRRGTDPQSADTDGDGAADGAEVLAGTDPLRAESKPLTEPTLEVGPISIGFTVHEGDVASDPKSFFVKNVGPGVLSWSVENNLPWLQVTPGGGTAPQQVTLVAMPGGLPVGVYTGQIDFVAPGAQGSPDSVLVKLTVKSGSGQPGLHFIRGDSNADGKTNISDPSATLTYLFIDATRAPPCIDAADSNDDGVVNITDAIYELGFLFLGGPPMPEPFPACGHDETPDGLECESSPACP